MKDTQHATSNSEVERVIDKLKEFYAANSQIKESHGLSHVLAVYNHARNAVACHEPPLSPKAATEVLIAALLHDVDDEKYFPLKEDGENNFPNALKIMEQVRITDKQCSTVSIDSVLFMIDLVSCSKNGNSVPEIIQENEEFYRLIPRWADRIEAVGKEGVVRCYRYNQERNFPLSSPESPRPSTLEQLWAFASPERFQLYQSSGGNSADMISHYYDKLLHIACPPSNIVRNAYLERKLLGSAVELIEVCFRFGRSGVVDEDYIQQLEKSL